MSGLNIALVGCGGIGGTHLTRWSEVSGANIVAVCDTDPALAARCAAEFGAEAHTDWRAMLHQSGIDVLDICTPPVTHFDIAIEAFKRGMHVLCDKPLGMTPQQSKLLVTAADHVERMLMPGFCHRFHPLIVFARELIENDDLGRITMFRCRFSTLFAGVEEQWQVDRSISGGGVLKDIGVHAIDLFRFLVGEIAEASGYTYTINPKLGVEDCAVIALKSDNGGLGVIECSWSAPGGRNLLELYGTAGACMIDYDMQQIRYKSADMMVWETKESSGPDRFQRQILHFADAVRGIQTLSCTGIDGLRADEIVAEIYGQGK
ncbi:MAG: Gfo/Idh/MocA family oxidoreductase [Chthonomonadales bacterium]